MTRLRVERSPRSGQDIVEIAVALGEHDPRLIDRFFEAIERALDLQAEHPQAGSPYHSIDRRLGGLRKWPVPGFPNHWLFYRPSLEAILVVRVLYAGRDLQAVLGEE